MDEEGKFLKEALKLAKKGMGWTNPNPMVGAVLVKNNQIIGKGYHKRVGSAHAEIEAINSAKKDIKGASLYINLEPCIHFGRTPPCVDEIIKSGIKRVVVSTMDPNPKMEGRGISKLQKMGILVSVGLLENEAKTLNEAFFTFHLKKRPFIAIKFAASLDGKIATSTGNSKWITNQKARNYARKLRAQYQAVLVGINTILKDDPHLGVRIKGKKDPIRIILDSTLKIPLQSKVLRDANLIIATTTGADKKKKKKLQEKGFTLLSFQEKRIPLIRLLNELKKREIISILVEGGGETIGNFVGLGLFDKVYAFYAPMIIGEGGISAVRGEVFKAIQDSKYLKRVSFERFADNYLLVGYNINYFF